MIECLLMPAFAWLNRFAGGGWPWRATWRGRPIYYAAAGAGLMTGLFYGHMAALAMTFGWFVWRIPGWPKTLDMGRDGDGLMRDFIVMCVRCLLVWPAFWPLGLAESLPIAVGLSVGITTSYVAAWGLTKRPTDPVPLAEWISGGVWGWAVMLAYGG